MKKTLDTTKRIPFYQQCSSFISKSIEEGHYAIGEFLPPERELSEQFGVNRLTLRKGLAELIRQGVLESVPGAGNRVVMKQGKVHNTKLVGCIINRLVGVRTLSPYYADIFSGIEAGITDMGYNLVFYSVKNADLWAPDGSPLITTQAINTRFSGVLIIGGLPEELASAYLKKGIRVVCVDHFIGRNRLSCVAPDNRGGALEMGRYLVRLGHKRMAFLAAKKDPVVDSRFEGFTQALKEAGCSFHPKDYINGGYEIRPAYHAMKNFLAEHRRNPPTAIVSINDEAAIGAMKALQEAGLQVPRDVSVSGFDDISWSAHSSPPLTTVRIPRDEMGRLAAQMLISQLESGKTTPATTLLNTELVVRESCAPI
ncbi:MAG: GntR family transcriptional regulator [Lentisphaerota bacterium]